MIQPGTGFTTKPGVAALRRTPGKEIGIAANPNGVKDSEAVKVGNYSFNRVPSGPRVLLLEKRGPLGTRLNVAKNS